MEPTASPLLSLMPLATAAPDGAPSLENLQNMAINGTNPATETPGLFASILSQLTPDEPVPAPLVADTTPVLPVATPDIAADVLPLTGNVLPLPASPMPATMENTVQPVALASEILADTLDQAELMPLSEPGQSEQLPVINTTLSANPPASTAPVVARLAINPAPEKPVAQPAAGIVRTAVADAGMTEEPIQAQPVAIAAKEVRVDRLDTAISQVLANQQQPQSAKPVQTAAIDAGAATTASPNPSTPQTAAAPATAQPTLSLDRPIGDPRWSESLGQRIVWMSENGMGRAEIRLNPPELGPLQVRVAVANDEARVAFNVQHGATRDMVEAALPRLREMFASQGIELTDASVSQHSPGDHGQTANMGDSPDRPNYGSAQLDATTDDVDEISGSTIIRDGLIDTYV